MKTIAERGVYSANQSGINSGINETRQKIMALMKDDPGVTTGQIADNLGVDRRNVEANIRALKKAGLVERKDDRLLQGMKQARSVLPHRSQ